MEIKNKIIKCSICGNQEGNFWYVVREMMFGTRDEFNYMECGRCGCLELKNAPVDLSKYYPSNYYAFQQPSYKQDNILKSFLKRERSLYCLGHKRPLGMLITTFLGKPFWWGWLRDIGLSLNSSVLDIGSGAGDILLALGCEGFSNLTGVDPFIKEDVLYKKGIKIYKKDISEVEGEYDFLMVNHAFEHMSDPLLKLKSFYKLLKHNGYLLIRIPIAASFAWKKYKTDWVQLDAPRHSFLHTRASMDILSKGSGFEIKDVRYDSKDFQFWASEQYRQDISLLADERSYAIDRNNSIFNKKDIAGFRNKADKLNREKDGDQAGFYLYKA